MSTASLFWFILYGIATLTFFAVASAITFFGIQDLRSLLSKANRIDIKKKNNEDSNSDVTYSRRGS